MEGQTSGIPTLSGTLRWWCGGTRVWVPVPESGPAGPSAFGASPPFTGSALVPNVCPDLPVPDFACVGFGMGF